MRSELKALRNHLDVIRGMFEPTVGIRRKIRVFGKDVLRTHVFFQLHQIALFAYLHMQRIKRFHPIELIGREIAFTERRHAQIDERVCQWRLAETAMRRR